MNKAQRKADKKVRTLLAKQQTKLTSANKRKGIIDDRDASIEEKKKAMGKALKNYSLKGYDPLTYPTSDALGNPRARFWFLNHSSGGSDEVSKIFTEYERLIVNTKRKESAQDQKIFVILYTALKHYHQYKKELDKGFKKVKPVKKKEHTNEKEKSN